MSLVLARVDERLVHGQVSVAWVPVLDVERILVVDEAMAGDPWERDLVEAAAPPGVTVEILDLPSAVERLAGGIPGRALLLVRSPALMLDLVRAGAPLGAVNLGGLHYREGARRFIDYLYVTREDIEALRGLAALGIRLMAQDLPGRREVDVGQSLAEGTLEYDQLPPGHS